MAAEPAASEALCRGGSRADAAGRSRARGAEDRGPGGLVRRKRGLGGVTVRAPASRAGGGHRAGGAVPRPAFCRLLLLTGT